MTTPLERQLGHAPSLDQMSLTNVGRRLGHCPRFLLWGEWRHSVSIGVIWQNLHQPGNIADGRFYQRV